MSGALSPAAREILERAARRGVDALPDPEAFDLVEALGFAAPRRLFAADANAAAGLDLDRLPGERVVVKAVAPGLVHKTEAGAVAVVDKSPAAIAAAAAEMTGRLGGARAPGFLLCEHLPHDTALGGELLLSLRWSDAYGPLVTLAPGGVQTELLAAQLDGGRAAAVLSPALDLERPASGPVRARPCRGCWNGGSAAGRHRSAGGACGTCSPGHWSWPTSCCPTPCSSWRSTP